MGWLSSPEYWSSRLLLQRALACIYFIAFLAALRQFRPLLGERGLQPIPVFLGAVPFRRAPSLFHAYYSDGFFALTCWAGLSLSAAAGIGLIDRGPLWLPVVVWLLLWALYLSVVNVGQTFYAFGWESILLEGGFLAIFLGHARIAPPTLALWLARWLLFRIEFGAGLIKIRGDSCWRDLTCLYYHHETQPMPNPLSWYFHQLPKALHRLEVAVNHFAQLVVPFGLFAPQPVAAVAAAIVIVTQSWLVLSGNFSWLNAMTIILAVSALDDTVFGAVLPGRPPDLMSPPAWHTVLVVAATVLTAVLSYWPIRNMLSRRQVMNYSFNPLHLVNTYGAFGSVSRERHEVVIEGTDAGQPPAAWKEYEFAGKPGDPTRRPPQVAPYHLRLDWLMWFAALSPAHADDWFVALVVRLLENDRATLALLRHNPFPDHPPTYIRARYYHYRFTTWRERRETGAWWVRTLVGEYLPPVRLQRRSDSASGPRRIVRMHPSADPVLAVDVLVERPVLQSRRGELRGHDPVLGHEHEVAVRVDAREVRVEHEDRRQPAAVVRRLVVADVALRQLEVVGHDEAVLDGLGAGWREGGDPGLLAGRVQRERRLQLLAASELALVAPLPHALRELGITYECDRR
jgi:hypothetical protein